MNEFTLEIFIIFETIDHNETDRRMCMHFTRIRSRYQAKMTEKRCEEKHPRTQNFSKTK